MPPALIALGAELVLRKGGERRDHAARGFLPVLRQAGPRARASSSRASASPAPTPDTLIRIVKLSKRFDSDISARLRRLRASRLDGRHRRRGPDRLRRHGRHPRARAPACEAALTGQPWTEDTVEAAAQALAEDYHAAQRPARIGRLPPRRRRQSGARPLARAATSRQRARCLTAPSQPAAAATTAPRAMSPAARSMSTICPSRPGTLHLAFGLAADGHARLTGARSRRGPRRARASSRSSPPPTSPARTMSARSSTTTCSSPRTRSSIPASRCSSSPRPALAPRASPRGWRRSSTEPLPALVTIAEALRGAARSSKTRRSWRAATPQAALAAAPHRLPGTLEIGGQEHFYLEGQAALAMPGEAGQLHVVSSTQHPSEVQHLIAAAARPAAAPT